jgi:small glutamine-rich tetratricopeptide repeat-containing protein alpha
VANQCLNSAFGVSLENPEQKKYSLAPHDLPSILNLGQTGRQKIEQAVEQLHKKQPQVIDTSDAEYKFYQYLQALKKRGVFSGITPGSTEYENTYTRARQKFFQKYQASGTTSETPAESKKEQVISETTPQPPPVTTSTTPSVDIVAQAEIFKNQGNQMLSSKQFSKAIENYNKAIELIPDNAIYYSNRAAAYSHMGSYEKAVEDCKTSIRLNPNYSKAYGRLGLAYFSLGKYAEAVEAYRNGLKFEPNNQSLKESLAAAQRKLNPSTTQVPPSQGAPRTAPGGATPNFSDMFNNPEVINSMGGLFGGQGGLANILNNPMFQTMAQQMMSNPQMMSMATNLMQDPTTLNTMMNSLGGMMGQGQEQDQSGEEQPKPGDL